ncbi:hypothetical protein HDU91_002095, partial [Kappamyces sp. JEL0680]
MHSYEQDEDLDMDRDSGWVPSGHHQEKRCVLPPEFYATHVGASALAVVANDSGYDSPVTLAALEALRDPAMYHSDDDNPFVDLKEETVQLKGLFDWNLVITLPDFSPTYQERGGAALRFSIPWALGRQQNSAITNLETGQPVMCFKTQHGKVFLLDTLNRSILWLKVKPETVIAPLLSPASGGAGANPPPLQPPKMPSCGKSHDDPDSIQSISGLSFSNLSLQQLSGDASSGSPATSTRREQPLVTPMDNYQIYLSS